MAQGELPYASRKIASRSWASIYAPPCSTLRERGASARHASGPPDLPHFLAVQGIDPEFFNDPAVIFRQHYQRFLIIRVERVGIYQDPAVMYVYGP